MFDGLPQIETVPLDCPSIKGLAYLLRHRELWPKGFRWDYNSRNRCAIGLMTRFWPKAHPITGYMTSTARLAKTLDISEKDAFEIFFNLRANPTPGSVAHAIDCLDEIRMVIPDGLEPPTRKLEIFCSSN